MTRRTLFMGLGLAVGFAGAAMASERNRTDQSATEGGEHAAAPADRKVISVNGNVGVFSVNGQERTVFADGSVTLDQVAKDYGSLDRAAFDRSRANLPSVANPKGNIAYADGAIAYDSDMLGASMPPPAPTTLADLKKVSPWVEEEIGGVNVTFLANGAIINDPNAQQRRPGWAVHPQQVSSKVDQNGVRHYADGAVFENEPTSRTQGQ